jgi:hypothetical protein
MTLDLSLIEHSQVQNASPPHLPLAASKNSSTTIGYF